MSHSGEFEGTMTVDGAVRCRRIAVWMDDFNLSVREPGRSRFGITLFPFNRGMIFTQTAQEIEDGLHFNFNGNRLGGISEGPLGHPADGEYNYRKIIAFRTDVTYSAEQIEVDIEGRTTSGIHAFDASKILPATAFSVRFLIPKERYVEFFQLKDHVHAHLLNVLGQVFG